MIRSLLVPLVVLILAGLPSRADAVPQKAIPAKAAVVMDASGNVLYAKFPKAKLAPASTVKLVTAMVAIDLLLPDAGITISKKASKVRQLPPKLAADETYTAVDLLHLTLMKSTNPAAVALAEAAAGSEEDFVALMNEKAREIGATDTRFVTASGLPKGTQYTTANDLALIMKTALSYPIIREILAKKEYVVRSEAGREIHFESSNSLLWLEHAPIIGKTGFTGTARHCFVGAMDTDTGPIFTAVLGARSRTSLWRATTMLAGVGVNPELASLFETTPPNRTIIQPQAGKNKPLTAGLRKETLSQDIQMPRLLRIMPQQLEQN